MNVLAFDVGGTSIKYGLVADTLEIISKDKFPTPENEENLMFLLDNITETGYIYSISKQQLENNKDIISLIRDRVTADENNKIISSFAIYSSQHKQSFFYSLKLTHYIQQLEKN